MGAFSNVDYAEKQKHKLRKTLNPLSRKAFQAVSFSATKDRKKPPISIGGFLLCLDAYKR